MSGVRGGGAGKHLALWVNLLTGKGNCVGGMTSGGLC